MPARALAFVAAAAMVVGAIAVRDRLDAREERATTVLRLVCATELAAACEAMAETEAAGRLEVTIEPAAQTADRLLAAASGAAVAGALDGWLVTAPWPAIVAGGRSRAGLDALVAPGPVLARSPVVLAMWADRAAVLARHCQATPPGWRCLGDTAGRRWADLGGQVTWGPVKPGHPDPSSAIGLTVLGAATAGFFGRSDVARSDLEDEGYRSWLTRLERSITNRSSSPFEDMLLAGPAAFDVVATVEADAAPLLARSARSDKPQLIYPAPVATADVVLGTVPGRAARLLADVVAGRVGRRALATAGWRVEGHPLAPGLTGTPALPPGSGLPDPGLLDALRQVAQEITR